MINIYLVNPFLHYSCNFTVTESSFDNEDLLYRSSEQSPSLMVIVMFISLPAMTVEQNIHILSNRTFCSPRKYHHTSPSPTTEGYGNQGGGGVQKEAFSERIEVAYRGIFPGGLSKISEFLINNCFSVEQAFSYFTVNGLQTSIIYLRSAKCFFHGLNVSFL